MNIYEVFYEKIKEEDLGIGGRPSPSSTLIASKNYAGAETIMQCFSGLKRIVKIRCLGKLFDPSQ